MAFRIEFNNLNIPISDSTGLLPQFDNPNYQEIFRRVQTNDTPVSRFKKGFMGCKISQVVNTLICLIWKPEFNREVSQEIINYIVRFIIIAFDKCMTSSVSNRVLFHFIMQNPAYINYTMLSDSNLVSTINPARCSFFIMGLVKDSTVEYPHGIISHFFTIIKRDSGFSILSSYGSICVAVPQKETPLELSELSKCIQALENQRSPNTQIKQAADRVVITFIQKYFLSNGEIKRDSERDEETRRMHYETYTPEEGAEMEIVNYTNSFHRFFYFPDYTDLVEINARSALSEMISRGGKKKYLRIYRRTKKVKRARRNKKTRRNKTSKKSRKNRK
jgi:hypothetical protein